MEYAYLLVILWSTSVPVIASYLYSRALRARIYSLECDTADLQDKLLHEVKKRAGYDRQKKDPTMELLDQIKDTTKIAPVKPWWDQYVDPALK
jgi:hypothetical protein